MNISQAMKLIDEYNRQHVLVIDTDHIYIYSHYDKKLETVFDLDDIKVNDDIVSLREKIALYLS